MTEKRKASAAWSWRHAFASSDLPPTTRLLLHTLGMFMNEFGEDCIPSHADLCRYSGLDKRTVVRHLALAKQAGWIGVSQHGFRGQKWKRNAYSPRWPERDLTATMVPLDQDEGGGTESPRIDEGGGRESPPLSVEGGGTESSPFEKGGGTESPKVGAQSHQDNTSPITSPIERGACGDEFERALKAWPTGALDSRKDARAAWRKLLPSERAKALEEIPRFVSANRSAGRKMICGFVAYLAEKRWEGLPERPAPIEHRPAAEQKPLRRAAPTRFQRKNPHLYPELFGGNEAVGTEAKP
ncbi:helix-turn-helix domain-containing protein [Mesorhizobium sp.]|uniref:helix-turn-helix domain-containing protein n=1 Tax=Mesorhizobium sp. TaxID=1871066 RepID=UPI000FEA9BE4|nr:helix-turn-helix domain-containing protein [Mesorhizobium sp.]RWP72374.1 MAG: hypothetical protein EOR09_21255 [Mesorhizobium sp.]